MTFLICRDQRTGEKYTDEAAAADKAEFGYYANEAADIEVEIEVEAADLHKGSGEPDNPDSADVTGGARVLNDIPYYSPDTGTRILGSFVLRAGQIIELTDEELTQAEEQALEEARAEAEPEYSP